MFDNAIQKLKSYCNIKRTYNWHHNQLTYDKIIFIYKFNKPHDYVLFYVFQNFWNKKVWSYKKHQYHKKIKLFLNNIVKSRNI